MVLKNSIKELRKERGWSQERLADMADVTRQTIISLEQGKYIASLPLAFQLAKIFERRIEDIFMYEEDRDEWHQKDIKRPL